MSLIRTFLDTSTQVALGIVPKWDKVNKFGVTIDADSGIPTDVWDGADGATSTDIWVAPTTARIHDIVSTSAADDGSPVGTGMRTVRIYGLTSWGSAEVSEDITLDGTTNVATLNSYVIIHRMVGLTFGSGGTNAGTITATAQTDATVTAAILAGNGQTRMAIYGVPSTQTLHLKFLTSAVSRAGGGVGTVNADLLLLVKENADQSDAAFIAREVYKLSTDNRINRPYEIVKSFTGPCIVKLQVETDTNNSEATGAFDAYLIDN